MNLDIDNYFCVINKIDQLVKKYFQKECSEYQFTPNEITVLMFLYNNAPILDTASDIVKYKGISKSLVTRSVDRLCKDGFITTFRDGKDKRVIHLKLSENSKDISLKLENTKVKLINNLKKDIDEKDLLIAINVIEQIRKNILNEM